MILEGWKRIIGVMPSGFFLACEDHSDQIAIYYNGSRFDEINLCGGGKPIAHDKRAFLGSFHRSKTSFIRAKELVKQCVESVQTQLKK